MSVRSLMSSRSAKPVPRTPPTTPPPGPPRYRPSLSMNEVIPNCDTMVVHSPTAALELLEKVVKMLEDQNVSSDFNSCVIKMSQSLKLFGAKMEDMYESEMDELFSKLGDAFRQAAKSEKLDKVMTFHFLEILELRMLKWSGNESVTNYYKQKILELNKESLKTPVLQRSISLNVNAAEYKPNLNHKGAGDSVEPPPVRLINTQFKLVNKVETKGAKPPSKNWNPRPSSGETIYKELYECGKHTIAISGENKDLVKAIIGFLEKNYDPCKPPSDHVVQDLPSFHESGISSQETKESFNTSKENNEVDKVSNCFPSYSMHCDRSNAIENGDSSESKKVIRYKREELLELAECNPERYPPNWTQICSDYPAIERKSPKQKLPYDWEEAFVKNSDTYIGSPCKSNIIANGLTKKKNFLEVLRPNAPSRHWNEDLGEWVENKEGRI